MNIVVTPSSMVNDHEGSCNSQIELCCGARRAITSLALCPKNIETATAVYTFSMFAYNQQFSGDCNMIPGYTLMTCTIKKCVMQLLLPSTLPSKRMECPTLDIPWKYAFGILPDRPTSQDKKNNNTVTCACHEYTARLQRLD